MYNDYNRVRSRVGKVTSDATWSIILSIIGTSAVINT